MDIQLRRKIEGIVGEISQVHVLAEQGCTSEVRKITTKDGSYIVKTSVKEKYREWLKAEAQVLKSLNGQNSIQVPTYYGFIEEQGSSHLIMSFEEGITLTAALKEAKDLQEKKSLLRSFGQFLQVLHEMKTIESLNHTHDWLDHQLVRADRYVRSNQTGGTAQLLEELRANKPQPVKQTMIHGDCTPDNVLVVEGEVRLFIDVAGMTVGDSRYDESLAIGRFVDQDELKRAFYEGYTRYKVTKEEYRYFDEGLYEFF